MIKLLSTMLASAALSVSLPHRVCAELDVATLKGAIEKSSRAIIQGSRRSIGRLTLTLSSPFRK
jgi:hypothetical protein